MKRDFLTSTVGEKLIIFCRYPHPGKSKTRLIPGVGAKRAAQIHRELAEFTLLSVQKLRHRRGIAVEIAFVADTSELMKEWLGDAQNYAPQIEGNLGDKMSAAFTNAFRQDCKKVVIIGTDCPELTPTILEGAFSSLDNHELVIGPAYDGGYYLIGLKKEFPRIFENISWGSEHVLKETMTHCSKDGINFHLLEKLHDIDRPEDLPLWTQIKK